MTLGLELRLIFSRSFAVLIYFIVLIAYIRFADFAFIYEKKVNYQNMSLLS